MLAAALAVTVAGCVAPSAAVRSDGTLEAEALAARRDAALRAFDRFRVRGGLGIWNDERSISARLEWVQRGETLDIDLVAPLGLGRARLVRRDGWTTLARGDASPLGGESADEVLQRALGLPVPVPLGQLALWLRGLPGAGRDVRRDAEGRLRSLRWRDADGTPWQARVLDYVTFGALELPALVTARGAGYRLRLVLRDWSADALGDVQGRGGTGVGEGADRGGGTLDAPDTRSGGSAERSPSPRRAIPGR